METPELRDRLPDIEMNLRTVGAGRLPFEKYFKLISRENWIFSIQVAIAKARKVIERLSNLLHSQRSLSDIS